MSHKVTFALFIFSLMILFSGDSYALECRYKNSVSTYFSSDVETTEYIRSVSANDLTAHHSGASSAGRVLGLAGGEVGIKFQVDFSADHIGNNKYCLYAKSIDVTFFAKPKIYIANNFARGSCEYNKVLRHENEHVDILRKTHREYARQYRRHLSQVAREVPTLAPFEIIDVNNKKDVLVSHIRYELFEYMNEVIMPELSKRQQAIDTNEEYAKVYSKCHRWDQKLETE